MEHIKESLVDMPGIKIQKWGYSTICYKTN